MKSLNPHNFGVICSVFFLSLKYCTIRDILAKGIEIEIFWTRDLVHSK